MPDSRSNDIFKALVPPDVDDSNRIIGLIAFALYKQEEIDFAENYKNKHGESPAEIAWDSFSNIYTNQKLDKLIDEAIRIQSEATAEVWNERFNAEMAKIKRNYIANLDTTVTESLKSVMPGKFDNVLWGVVSSAVFAFVMAFCIWATKSNITTLDLPGSPYEVKIVNPVTNAPPQPVTPSKE